VRFDSDELPAFANSLRHTYLSIAAGLGVSELICDMLTTHQPRGITQKVFRWPHRQERHRDARCSEKDQRRDRQTPWHCRRALQEAEVKRSVMEGLTG
jgi:hypothetical protein